MPETSSDAQHFFIFVNPKSGGNAASVFLPEKDPQINLGDHEIVNVYPINAGEKHQKPGFLHLKSVIAATPRPVKVIVAGGDGTVMWCLSELEQHQIELSKVIIGVLPFGTGNDFAKSLEWTLPKRLKPFDENYKQLRELVTLWDSGTVVKHDIWTVDVELRKDGHFLKVDSEDRQKHELRDAAGNILRKMTVPMCNYFSLGVESRIGIGFDKGRSNNAVKNKMVYTKEGLKKSLFTNTLKVNEIVHSLTVGKDGSRRVAFTTQPGPHSLLQESASLICVNIPSFASGMNLWGTSKVCGLQRADRQLPEELTGIQKMGDGVLEWVCFSSVAAIGMEATMSGHAKRVLRDSGPFRLNFHDTIHSYKIYYQVDGEFFVLVNPKFITITHSMTINVLANPASTKKDHYQVV